MAFDLSDKPVAQMAHKMATSHHSGIVRKYTDEPYIRHPERIVVTLLQNGETDQHTLAMALLHDCAEDEDIHGERMALGTITFGCGVKVRNGVAALTEPTRGNRASRKARYIDQLKAGPPAAITVKFADIIDNVRGIARLDPNFAKTYIEEKIQMWTALAPLCPNAKITELCRLTIEDELADLAADAKKRADKVARQQVELEALATEIANQSFRDISIF